MATNLHCERTSIAPDDAYPFHVRAIKYTSEGNPHQESDDALTLTLLTHSLGVHMETWEITAAHLFTLSTFALSRVKIREIFSIESPNHGGSALVNAEQIAKRPRADCRYYVI
ncbi:hypothetical protein FB451DRAFT_1202318 [Mycena latifolia]|nr:hypothetical protein FB451DRAFT_1202318 [Mycena latifolia]